MTPLRRFAPPPHEWGGVLVVAFVLIGACGNPPAAAVSPTPSLASPSPTPSPSPSPSPQPFQRAEPSLPAAVEETAAAAAGGKLYVMGGFDAAGASLASVYVFDGTSWTSGPALPLPLDHPSAATLDDQVYIAGGHSNGRDSARVFRLDGDHWTELAPLHYARGGHALIAAARRLYAIGGNNVAGNVGPAESYDPSTGGWSVLNPLPQPRNHVLGFALDDTACVAGGRAPTTARLDCVLLTTGAWSRPFGDLPAATSGGGALAFPSGAVVVAGGQDASETRIVNQVDVLQGKSWTAAAHMLVPRHGFELALFDGRAWACGGGTAPGLHPVAACTSLGDPATSTL